MKKINIIILSLMVSFLTCTAFAMPNNTYKSEIGNNNVLIDQKAFDLFGIVIKSTPLGFIYTSKSAGFEITFPKDWFIGPKLHQGMSPDKRVSLTILPTMTHSDHYAEIAKRHFGTSNEGYYTFIKSGEIIIASNKVIWFLATSPEGNQTNCILTYVIPGIKNDYWAIFTTPFSEYESDREICDKIIETFRVSPDI